MNTLSTVSPFIYSEQDLLSFILSTAGERKNPIALWRLPDSNLTHLLVCEKVTELDDDQFIEDLDTGFLLAPFDKSLKRIFLCADHLLTFEKGKLRQPSSEADMKSVHWLSEQLASYERQKYNPPAAGGTTPDDINPSAFLDIVGQGIAEIGKGTFQKIVPSRTHAIELPGTFDVIEAHQKLRATYPQALISYVSVPGIGNWLGASPEVLVSIEDNSVFRTVALAGTQAYTPGTELRSVAWTQKEIEEQALVERYIISCFKKVRLREYDELGPRTAVAGNLMHLKSEFTVDMKATNFPQIGTVMLDLLHPTSAVCGMPLEPSLEFLKRHECYDRGFYAGYLGPVNVQNNIDLFVNIRCMQICQTKGILYAGAGVTIDSDPQKEWEETEMKFNTLLNVIL